MPAPTGMMDFLTSSTNPYSMLLKAFAPQLISMMFGAGSEQKDYEKELRGAMDPQTLMRFIAQQRGIINQGSVGARTNILTQSLGTSNALARAYAASGAPNGIGTTAATVANSQAGFDLAQLDSANVLKANESGMSLYQNNINNLLNRGPRAVSPGHMALASGLDNLRTWLMNYQPRTGMGNVAQPTFFHSPYGSIPNRNLFR